MERKPHRCPNCEGQGRRPDSRVGELVTCTSCAGTGVVWEPGPQESAEMQPAPDDVLDLTGS
jgi:DnaJ-class molecular chaperone